MLNSMACSRCPKTVQRAKPIVPRGASPPATIRTIAKSQSEVDAVKRQYPGYDCRTQPIGVSSTLVVLTKK